MDETQLLYVILASTASAISIIGLVWRASWWMSDQFKLGRDLSYRLVETLEDKFDIRHVANVERLTKIETKLDIVIKNGH